MLSNTNKEWIDRANYYELLKRWRFSSMDDIFIGSSGQYYHKIMNEKREKIGNSECVRISKLIGWG